MFGALGGGILGAGSAWLGTDKLAIWRLLGLPLGGYEATQGPIQNRNFPYVVLGRFLFLADALSNRTHAHRERLQISEGDPTARLQRLDRQQQAQLHRALDRLRQQKPTDDFANLLQVLLGDK